MNFSGNVFHELLNTFFLHLCFGGCRFQENAYANKKQAMQDCEDAVRWMLMQDTKKRVFYNLQ